MPTFSKQFTMIFSFVTLLTTFLIADPAAAKGQDGYYLGAYGGFTYTSQMQFADPLHTGTILIDFENNKFFKNYRAGAEIGYKTGPWRYEVEGTFGRSTIDGITTPDPGDNTLPVDGNLEIGGAMINLYYEYDIPQFNFVPFFGIGGGYVRVKNTFDSISFLNHVSGRGNAFALQAMFGLGYFFDDGVLFLEYRYFRTPSIETTFQTTTTGGPSFVVSEKIENQSILLGLNILIGT